MSEAERCETQLNIPLCVRAQRSVAHGQSKRSAKVPLTLTGKPNPAQMRSIKTSANLYRILEFAFRNISLEKLLLSLFHILELANDQRAALEQRWVSGEESSERRSPLWRKYDR